MRDRRSSLKGGGDGRSPKVHRNLVWFSGRLELEEKLTVSRIWVFEYKKELKPMVFLIVSQGF